MHGRYWARRPRAINPARSNTLMCLEIAGRVQNIDLCLRELDNAKNLEKYSL